MQLLSGIPLRGPALLESHTEVLLALSNMAKGRHSSTEESSSRIFVTQRPQEMFFFLPEKKQKDPRKTKTKKAKVQKKAKNQKKAQKKTKKFLLTSERSQRGGFGQDRSRTSPCGQHGALRQPTASVFGVGLLACILGGCTVCRQMHSIASQQPTSTTALHFRKWCPCATKCLCACLVFHFYASQRHPSRFFNCV